MGNDPPTLEELGRDKHLALIMFYSIFPKHVMISGNSFLLIKTTQRARNTEGRRVNSAADKFLSRSLCNDISPCS